MLDINMFNLDDSTDDGIDDILKMDEISSSDIAIIGVACKFPMSDNIDAFWEKIRDGVECISDLPEGRKKDSDALLRIADNTEGSTGYLKAGYLNEIDKFDYKFFKLTPKEASLMDPHQRLFLETAVEAIEDAGYGGGKLNGSNTGVYVAKSDLIEHTYMEFIVKAEPLFIPLSVAGNLPSIIPSRISYMLDLNGPSMLIDTACSSSLVALHLACQGFAKGDCEAALVGGVRVYVLPNDNRPKMGIESEDGSTRTFDESSSGTGIGEGVAVVLLKPLSEALKDRDNVYAVIKSSAVNQDGNSIGITAPNVAAQAAVIEKAWKAAKIEPETISCIEAHGTGTQLGDPIEIDGIKRAFRKYTDKKQFCAVTAVKTNIGHLYDVAGMAGLIKMTLALKHKKLLPSLNFNLPNKNINFENSPVYVNDKLREWETNGDKRRCGLSSFGMSGTNCHIVLEEYIENNSPSEIIDDSENILALSAKSENALKNLVKNYIDFIDQKQNANIKDICYTANTGRGHYNYRLAVLARNITELKDRLIEISENGFNHEQHSYLYYGSFETILKEKEVRKAGEITNAEKNTYTELLNTKLKQYAQKGKNSEQLLYEICGLYVKGADVEWDELYSNEKRSKVSIPGYPFEKERCWIEVPEVKDQISLKQNSNEIKLLGKSLDEYTQTEKLLAQIFKELMGFNEINVFDNFSEMGIDSIFLAKVQEKLERYFPGKVSVTNLFAYPTISELARFIEKSGATLPEYETFQKQGEKTKKNIAQKDIAEQDIAIIGMAAKFPQSEDIKEYWNNISDCMDCITTLPVNRQKDCEQIIELLGMDKEKTKYNESGYLSEIDKFDYKFFQISPKEASLIDPCQRLFLETAYKAIEDAGYGGGKLAQSRTGVFVGFGSDLRFSYGRVVAESDSSSGQMAIPGNLSAILPSRLSYLLDFKGPSMVIDTACSSSLVSVHQACKSIQNGECDTAIAGGVKINILPIDEDETKLGIESSDGRTKAFDNSTDGTGSGEGVGAVLLKPLSRALSDGDCIYAVIKGSATNQDGTSMGITAPNPLAQTDVLVNAWKDAKIDPETISYIEAHGTGTKLGDPIEIDGIQWAFNKFTDKKQFCALGSVKANIGHLYECAGIASIIKAALLLRHKQIAPLAHFKSPNVRVNFENSPVYINDRLRPWVANEFPRRCGVSAFGLSGTNCHVVLEEAPEIAKKDEEAKKLRVLVISAKSKVALQSLVQHFKKMAYVEPELDLSDVCYTSGAGRGHYSFRVAFVFEDGEEYISKLVQLDNLGIDSDFVEGIYYGEHKVISQNTMNIEPRELTQNQKREFSRIANEKVKEFISDGKGNKKLLDEICELYVKGAEIQWDKMYEDEDRRRVHIPVYPFEPRRCWITIPDNKKLRGKKFDLSELLGRDDIPLELSNEIRLSMEKWKQQLDTMTVNIESKEEYKVKLKGRPDEEYRRFERLIADVWGETLGLEEISIRDNFYELGGDSIIAMKIGNILVKKLQVKIEVADILRCETIEEFAACTEEKSSKASGNVPIYSPIKRIGEQDYYGVSAAQKRMFVVSHLKGSGTSYNLPGALMFEGRIDRQKFEGAFITLIQRHEIFRTSFELVGNDIMQHVHKDVEFNVEYVESDEECIPALAAEFIQPFNLSKAPLLRVRLLKIAKDRHVALFDMHHIISDWTSLGIMIREFVSLYMGYKLPELSVQYKDFSEWQNEFIMSEGMKVQEQYWLKKFEQKVPVLNLPTDYKRPPVKNYEGNRLKFVVREELTSSLHRLVSETGTTLYMILMASFNVLLHKYTGQEDIVVGTPVIGRNHVDVENMMGVFINMLAIRNHPQAHKTFSTFLKEVKKNTLEIYENQDYQFDELVEKLELETDMSRNPLFETMFALQNIEIPNIEIEGLVISPYELEGRVAQYDITFEAVQKDGEILFNVDYCTKLFKKETINRIIDDYIKILNIIVSDRNISLDTIRLENKYSKLENILGKDIEFDF